MTEVAGLPPPKSVSVSSSAKPQARAAISDFWVLTKPEVNFLIVIATSVGFCLGRPRDLHSFPFATLFNVICGTLLVASGAGTLNQCLENRFDARMRRTCRRPVAAGRVRPATAARFGIALSIIGAAYLLITVNTLVSALATFTLLTYLFVYTPLKRKTPLCTLAGAFTGAMPPLIGWAAASGSIKNEKAWMLYALLFLWQFPHFMSIAWMYREDYDRAGYRVLPRNNATTFLRWLTFAPSVALFIISLMSVYSIAGGIVGYYAMALLGLGLLYRAARLVRLQSGGAARQLLKATILYLPLAFLVLVLGNR